MTLIFLAMMIASCVWLLFQKPDAILSTSLNAVHESLLLAVTLAGIYIFWMAIAEIATRSGLIDKIAKFLKKPIKFLFGKQSEEVNSYIATNIAANMIGASGAATPAAISAIEHMATPEQNKASPPMIMLFILAATSLQLIPTTIIGILQANGSVNPARIILPTFIVSFCATAVGVVLVKIFCRRCEKGGE
ncbi:MAG: spore maturation protein [Clostridia bacterium]|nr:spore maturation protein [Clostridia bacterium]